MPRTEFITLFGIVKSKFKDDLFKLFDNLACYKTVGGKTILDTDYCTGTIDAPVSNNKFGSLEYTNYATTPPTTVTIKDWITGIDKGTGLGNPPVNALSNFDRSIDNSIGGRDTSMEKIYQSSRSAPLIEFRDLDTIQTFQVEQFMTDVDLAIQTLHKKFANAPSKNKRDAPTSCVRSFAVEATNLVASMAPTTPSPTVVPPVDPPSKPSCRPFPFSAVKDAHESELQKAAKFFCNQYAANTVPNNNGPINIADTIIAGDRQDGRVASDVAYVYPTNLGSQDDVYDFTVTSVPSCTPSSQAGAYNLATPVKDNQCADILHSAWMQCNNKGRGGSITAGCLVYGVAAKF